MTHFVMLMTEKIDDKVDDETGELLPKPILNTETGETEYFNNNYCNQSRRSRFRIPLSSLRYQRPIHTPKPKTPSTSSDSSTATAVLWLVLPTILFFPPISLLVIILEFVLHVWAHKKNGILHKNSTEEGIYYESPLHIYTSEFCYVCLDEKFRTNFTKYQDKQKFEVKNSQLRYVKSVVI